MPIGSFEHRTVTARGKVRVVKITQDHAYALLEAHGMTRDIAGAITRMKNNPWAQLNVSEGVIYWNPGNK